MRYKKYYDYMIIFPENHEIKIKNDHLIFQCNL